MNWIQQLGLVTCRFGQRKNSTREVEEKNSQEAYEIQFAAYKQFCDDTTVEKKRLIKEANEKIEVLQNRSLNKELGCATKKTRLTCLILPRNYLLHGAA